MSAADLKKELLEAAFYYRDAKDPILRQQSDLCKRAADELSARSEKPCATRNGDPAVCATVPGLRHCEAAQRSETATLMTVAGDREAPAVNAAPRVTAGETAFVQDSKWYAYKAPEKEAHWVIVCDGKTIFTCWTGEDDARAACDARNGARLSAIAPSKAARDVRDTFDMLRKRLSGEFHIHPATALALVNECEQSVLSALSGARK